MKKPILVLASVGIIVVAGALGLVYWSSMNAARTPSDEPRESPGMGFRAGNLTDGNWLVQVVTGSLPLKNLKMMVTDPGSGARMVDKSILDLVPAKNDPDAIFNDSNANNRFDAGDSVLLKCSSPNIKTGYKVQFLVKESIVGTIKELP